MSAIVIPLPGAAHAPVVQTRRAGRWPRKVICFAKAKHGISAVLQQVDALMAEGREHRQTVALLVEVQRLELHRAAICEARAVELSARAKRVKALNIARHGGDL